MHCWTSPSARAWSSRSSCEIDDGLGYEELLPLTDQITDGSIALRVLDLPTLISVKLKTGRGKDRMVVPLLVATLQERSEPKEP